MQIRLTKYEAENLLKDFLKCDSVFIVGIKNPVDYAMRVELSKQTIKELGIIKGRTLYGFTKMNGKVVPDPTTYPVYCKAIELLKTTNWSKRRIAQFLQEQYPNVNTPSANCITRIGIREQIYKEESIKVLEKASR